MLEKWNSLPKKEQNLVLILFSAVIIGGYLGFVYLSLGKEVFETQKLVNRKKNRLEVKTKNIGKIDDKAMVYEEKIKKIEPQLKKLQDKYNNLRKRFVPLDSPEKIESLRLEISEYARFANVAIINMGTVGGRKADLPETNADITRKNILNNTFKRMLIEINSYTTFKGLLGFLDGMDELSYYASIVQINIKAVVPEMEPGQYEKASSKKLIAVDMVIAI